jgi:uncharacterized protein (DUF952 family)
MPYDCAQLKKGNRMNRDRYIYKALTPQQWAEFQTHAIFTGSPVDLADGYIHMSCAAQLKATLDKWYAELTEVILLQIEASVIAADLKYEVSRGGAEFPHLFADLPMTAVGQVWVVSPEARGSRGRV